MLGFQNPTEYAAAFKNTPEIDWHVVHSNKYLHWFLKEMASGLPEETKGVSSAFLPVSTSIINKAFIS